jgi:hypothetical protein
MNSTPPNARDLPPPKKRTRRVVVQVRRLWGKRDTTIALYLATATEARSTERSR